MPNSFVIILHTGFGPEHYDFMLETGPVLATWQLVRNCLDLGEGESTPARKLPAHRLAYLTCQGPVSGGRGQVLRVCKGAFETLVDDSCRLVVRLDWPDGSARFELACHASADEAGDDWLITRRPVHS